MTRAVRTALSLLCVSSPSLAAADVLRAHDVASLQATLARVQPGDTISLASGTWRDVRLRIDARGTAERPITVTAETPGGVVVSGRSDLTVGGAHLVVSGLVFRDGHAPGDALIRTLPASANVRLTEMVVDGFTKPDRRTPDTWVSLEGRGNRLDHAWFAGKGNAGAVLRAGDTQRVDDSYFGPRQPLGGMGGETVVLDGAATFERNLFDRVDGGPAIVAVGGRGAVLRGNAAVMSRGSFVLGGDAVVAERNVFRGNGSDDTGGIRVTGSAIVRDNYFDRLSGSALASEGQATAQFRNNTVTDSGRLTFASGTVTFDNNLVRNTVDPIRIGAAQVSFAGNVSSFDPPAAAATGMTRDKHDFAATPAGLLRLPTAPEAGAPVDLKPLAPAGAGPAWYPKVGPQRAFAFGVEETAVQPGTLAAAVAAAAPSAVLALVPGDYRLDAPLVIDRPLTLRGTADVRLSFRGATAFQLAPGGSLKLEGITISGRTAPRRPGNAVVRASLSPATQNYTVMLDQVTLADLDRARDFDVIATTAGSFADRIDLRGVSARDISGALVAAASESDGRYSARLVRITDARLSDVGVIAEVVGGGAELGPKVEVTYTEVRGGGATALRLTNVVTAEIAGNRFDRAGAIEVSAQGDTSVIRCNRFVSTPAPRVSARVLVESDEQAPRCVAHRIALGEEP